MDNKELQTVDVMKTVREKIQDSFVNLIPQDKWDDLIQKEINDFMDASYDNQSYNDYHRVTKFKQLVRSELEKNAKDYIFTYITERYKEKGWDYKSNKLMINKEIEKIIVENGDKIFAGVIQVFVQNAINNMSGSNPNAPRY